MSAMNEMSQFVVREAYLVLSRFSAFNVFECDGSIATSCTDHTAAGSGVHVSQSG